MTITVRLPAKLEAKLRKCLEPQDIKLSDFVCQAIEEKLERTPEKKPSAYELGKHVFGKYSSRETDRAERAEEFLREIFREKHRRRRPASDRSV
jgi:hypothetical protein